MKIPPRNIDGFVKNPPPDIRAVLVYGPDEGLVRERMALLAKAAVDNPSDPFSATDIDAAKLSETPALLMDETMSISMLGGARLVRLRGATDKAASIVKEVLPALKKGGNFVLVEGGELGPRSALRILFENAGNAAALPCYVEDERDMARVISDALRQAGYRISSDALTLMAASITGDRAAARGAIEKLVTYMGPMKEIGVEDVAACTADAAALPLDDLARLAAQGRFAEADRVLSFLLSEGTPAVTALRALQNHYLRLHLVKSRMQNGESMDAAIARLRPPLFFKQKPAFETQAAQMGMAQVEQALSLIATAEARCKQTGSDPALIASRALLSLCQLSSRAAARRRA